MKEIIVSRLIPFPIEKVWPMLANIDAIHRIHPMVESSPIVSQSCEGVGTTRVCKLYNGMEAVEEVTKIVDQQLIVIDIVKSGMPFKKAFGEFYTSAINGNNTFVEVRMYLEPKYGVLGSLMYTIMLKPMMTNILKGVLKGLEDHLSTGKIVGKSGKLIGA